MQDLDEVLIDFIMIGHGTLVFSIIIRRIAGRKVFNPVMIDLLIFQFIQILPPDLYGTFLPKEGKRPLHILSKTIYRVIDRSNDIIVELKDDNAGILKINGALMIKITRKPFHFFHIADHPVKQVYK